MNDINENAINEIAVKEVAVNEKYNELMTYIQEKNRLGSVPGLFSIKELLTLLGNPEKEIPAIHIAGTNGKGSIMAYIENALIAAGYRVGRYISPTIFDYRERIQLNKEYISKEDLVYVMDVIRVAENEMVNVPTSFEIETAAAFYYFRMKKVDVILIECGMGGRLDATNVLSSNKLSILASISMDHMAFLGDDISAISKEKLGIVPKGGVLFSYPQVNEAELVINNYVNENDISLINTDRARICVEKEDISGTRFIYRDNSYEINMLGDYQVFNACTAIDVLLYIKRTEWNNIILRDCDIKNGLKVTDWLGRFTKLSSSPIMIFDGAHNEDAWLKLCESLNLYFTNREIVFIIGVLKDKEVDKMVNILSPLISYVYTITPPSDRALSGDLLKEKFIANDVSAEFCEDYREALRAAKCRAKEDGVIVVSGSLSFLGRLMDETKQLI